MNGYLPNFEYGSNWNRINEEAEEDDQEKSRNTCEEMLTRNQKTKQEITAYAEQFNKRKERKKEVEKQIKQGLI